MRFSGKETGEGLRKAKVGTLRAHGCVGTNQVVTSEGVGPLNENGRRAVMVALRELEEWKCQGYVHGT